MSQTDEIIEYMQKNGGITQAEATRFIGCTRLSARIWDIEDKKGLKVNRETVCGLNRHGKKTYFTRYSLGGGR